jgi:dihydroxy-acid dehydratase
LERRRAAWQPRHETYTRGWAQLYTEHVTQADTGCDLDFLIGASGAYVPRESH